MDTHKQRRPVSSSRCRRQAGSAANDVVPVHRLDHHHHPVHRPGRVLLSLLVLAGWIQVCNSHQSVISRHSRHSSSRYMEVPLPPLTALSRVRRDPSPGLEATPALDGQGANLYKPVILNCNDTPIIKEEQPIDTAVVQVRAQDKDDPKTGAGRIVYSIVSTHHKFKINPTTGDITTNKIFNRDEPDREKVVHVTVKASDQGRPNLEDVCTITVTIDDINDNAPIFDRANYDIAIAQDTRIGAHIIRVSATDIDEGMNQNITYVLQATNFQKDIDYFRWDDKTGVVTLAKKLDKVVGSVFQLEAIARDGGIPPKQSKTDVTIDVKESNDKPPKFLQGPGAEIELSEGLNDFNTPIASYTADSQIPDDPTLFFELLSGRTEQTNKGNTFRALQDENNQQRVNILLSKPLEYEKVQAYTLTLQVSNIREGLRAEAQLNIKVKDENNKSPVFTNIDSGAVLEHEPPGTVVMVVSAIDGDGTYPNNRVKYSIPENRPDLLEKFDINPDTGVITTKVEFDREEKSYYALPIVASDGAPSSLLKNNKPNKITQKFKIVIKDKNDNPPYFPQQIYRAEVPEDADIGSKVIEVKAEDKDKEASLTTYSIDSGNLNLAFSIEDETGFIRVNKELDYETIKQYTLIIKAWDGQFSNTTTVHIDILNVNDMNPVFDEEKYTYTIKENFVPTYSIFRVKARDPDIEDPTAPQNITYFLDQTNQIAPHFQISTDGQLRIMKPLDRDLPNGFPVWSMYVFAKDENGGPNGRESFVEFEITLEDVNDNAPFLNMPDGLVWPENSPPGEVGLLEAVDYDTPKNGPPFTFRIDPKAPTTFKNKFGVRRRRVGGANGDDYAYYLETRKEFDREAQKVYNIPIEIADNQGLKAVSLLKLTIGDKNDNPMKPGASEIFVYNYEGRAPTTQIGRVYVDDPDDWDLPDKTFQFDPSPPGVEVANGFSLDTYTGMISMRQGIQLNEEVKTFRLRFLVEDRVHAQMGPRAVPANVTVTVKKIPREAVVKSGSVRLAISPEEFVNDGGREKLTKLLRGYINANSSVVDVFTILPALDGTATDVRFAAHGSPYYAPERMEVTIARRKADLQRQMGGIGILMIHVDECITGGSETSTCAEGSCYNSLEIEDRPTAIMTNTTTFVGVSARVEARCGCRESRREPTCAAIEGLAYHLDAEDTCLNGGECQTGRCKCPADNADVFGPHCEKLAASFRYGWTTQRGISACANTTVAFRFTTKQSRGLLLYQGPSPNTVVANHTDFFAIEIQEGKLKYYLNYGARTQIGSLPKLVSDGEEHSVELSWTNSSVKLVLDHGECVPNIRDCQLENHRPKGDAQFFNSNGPLQVGGLYFGADRLRSVASELNLVREELPAGSGFAGCLRDLQIRESGHVRYVSVGTPSDGESYQDGCSMEYVLAVEATGMNLHFLIVILVILAAILTTVIILTMYRRRRVHYSDKDIDCDIRENIINYEDEGGGEGDQTGYDLSVLRMMAHENGGTMLSQAGLDKSAQPLPAMSPPSATMAGGVGGGEVPGVGDFLDETKDRVDQDPEATPFDDLRHYAYEGDGNSGGSLSSLNSAEDDADLEFEYLHNFGPRFKKLADMYGRESDSDESQEGVDNLGYFPSPGMGGVAGPGAPPASESWC